jgi:hypothetical protein
VHAKQHDYRRQALGEDSTTSSAGEEEKEEGGATSRVGMASDPRGCIVASTNRKYAARSPAKEPYSKAKAFLAAPKA